MPINYSSPVNYSRSVRFNKLNMHGRYVSLLAVVAMFGWMGCNSADDSADAYGNFEADDVIISAETSGRLLSFSADEGDVLGVGQVVGLVDTTQLVLQRKQIVASQAAVRSRIPGVVAEINVLEEQKRVATVEKTRVENLIARQAATQKQLDDVEGQISVIDRKIKSIRSRNAPILAEVEVLEAQIAQVDEQLTRSIIVNPVAGSVLTAYSHAHEMVAAGRPLYKIAPLDTLVLRAFVSGSQLPNIRIGESVTVLVDKDSNSNQQLSGKISWISSEAEFTPKLIQTKEERVNLVYAFKVDVPNPNGIAKIGMPGEVVFSNAATSTEN